MSEKVPFDVLAKKATGKKLYIAKQSFEEFVVDILKTPQQRTRFLATLKNGVSRIDALHYILMYHKWAFVMKPFREIEEKKRLAPKFLAEFAKYARVLAEKTKSLAKDQSDKAPARRTNA